MISSMTSIVAPRATRMLIIRPRDQGLRERPPGGSLAGLDRPATGGLPDPRGRAALSVPAMTAPVVAQNGRSALKQNPVGTGSSLGDRAEATSCWPRSTRGARIHAIAQVGPLTVPDRRAVAYVTAASTSFPVHRVGLPQAHRSHGDSLNPSDDRRSSACWNVGNPDGCQHFNGRPFGRFSRRARARAGSAGGGRQPSGGEQLALVVETRRLCSSPVSARSRVAVTYR